MKALALVLVIPWLVSCGKEEVRGTTPASNNPPATAKTEPAPVVPKATDTVFKGSKRKKDCHLTLHREWFEGGKEDRQSYRAEVSTSYDKDGERLGKVTVAFTEDGAGKVLAWENKETKEFLRIDLKNAEEKIANPDSFNVRIFNTEHGHTHANACAELKK